MKTALLALVSCAACAAAPSEEWKFVQTLDVDRPCLMKLGLPAETLGAARPGLEDLRILDPAGREVPYLIERPVRGAAVMRAPKKFGATLEGKTTVILIETGVAQPLEAVELETPAAGFIKAVAAEGSPDGLSWQPLAAGLPIFRQASGAARLRVPLPQGVRPFIRLTVDDARSEPIPFTGAKLVAAAPAPAPEEDLPVRIAERGENGSRTRLVLDLGAANLTPAWVRFETGDQLFTRPVSAAVRAVEENEVSERTVARGAIYRVAVQGLPSSEQIELPLDLPVPGRELLVFIENGDSPPLRLTAVRVARRPVYALFLAREAGPHRILVGNPRCDAPRYDVAGLTDRLKDAAPTALAPSTLAANPAYRPAEALREIGDTGTALDTAAWRYRAAVRTARPGVQQLELGPDALSHADPSLRDVRLVRGGVQRPYLMERTSRERAIAPTVAAERDPNRPAISRWRLTLPRERLPVITLACRSRTPLFRRRVCVYERVKDRRGEAHERRLGAADWVRVPPATDAPLEVRLDSPPLTDTLFLETDNGDNPPIALDEFTLSYPVTRLLFRAPAEGATYLYYGNRRAESPRYDLSLIAPRLLAEERAVASTGAEEELRRSAPGELFSLSGTKGVLFWAALSLAVVALLAVIARLLPKAPPPAGTGEE